MFPIRDHNPRGGFPVVTLCLIGLNVTIYFASLPITAEPAAYAAFLHDYALFPNRVSDGRGLLGLVSSMFVHGGFMHLAGNMLFLWIFGDNLEDSFGRIKFAAFYLLSGIGAGLIHVVAAPASGVPTVGASGAIAGVLGGYLLQFPRAKVDVLLIFVVFFRVFTVPAWVMLGLWFALQLLNGSASSAEEGGVAYWAHAGGFVVGFLLTLPYFLAKGGPGYWGATKGKPPHPEADYRFVKSQIPRVRRR